MVYRIHEHGLQNGPFVRTFYGRLVPFYTLGGCHGNTLPYGILTAGYGIWNLLCLTTQSVGLEPFKIVTQMDEC